MIFRNSLISSQRHLLKCIHYPSFVDQSSRLPVSIHDQHFRKKQRAQNLISKTLINHHEFRQALKYNDINNAWTIYNHLVWNPNHKNEVSPLHPEEHSLMLQQLVFHVHPRVASYRSYRIYTRMKQFGVPVDRRDYHALLLVLVRNRDVERASLVYQEYLSKLKPDSRAASLMLSLYGDERNSIKTFEIWEFIKTIPGALENPDVWAVAIDAFAKCGLFDTSLELFNEYKDNVNSLKSKRSNVSKCKLDRKPFEAMIKAYGIRGYLDSAKGLFKELENGKNMLDIESFDAIIHACKSCHNFDEGLFYWNKLLEFTDKRVDKSQRVWKSIPLQSTICTIMSFYAENRNLDAVLELYQKYRKYQQESLELLEIITWTLLHLEKHSEAIEVYDRLQEKSYIPSNILSSTIEHFRNKIQSF
jgi:tetratricopeptide (TPR) repeat protein